jgi:hypothetical protein
MVPDSGNVFLTAEGELDLALQDREHLLEVVPVRRRAAAVGHTHVDQAVLPVRLLAGDEHGVRVAHQRDACRNCPTTAATSSVRNARGTGIACGPDAVNMALWGWMADGRDGLTAVRGVVGMGDPAGVHELHDDATDGGVHRAGHVPPVATCSSM